MAFIAFITLHNNNFLLNFWFWFIFNLRIFQFLAFAMTYFTSISIPIFTTLILIKLTKILNNITFGTLFRSHFKIYYNTH